MHVCNTHADGLLDSLLICFVIAHAHAMPPAFDACVAAGGKVRTKQASGNNIPICKYPTEFWTPARVKSLKSYIAGRRSRPLEGGKAKKSEVTIVKDGHRVAVKTPKWVSGEARPSKTASQTRLKARRDEINKRRSDSDYRD